MAHRQFIDADGSVWSVWDVQPAAVERSFEQVQPNTQPARRNTPWPLTQELARGWLCFESGEKKRRLAPIPSGWEAMSTEALQDLCTLATPVRRSIRGL